jgi:hypothetical protein
MLINRSLRYPVIVGGSLALIAGLLWPAVRGARQAAQRAGIT